MNSRNIYRGIGANLGLSPGEYPGDGTGGLLFNHIPRRGRLAHTSHIDGSGAHRWHWPAVDIFDYPVISEQSTAI
jgi:hypothetical protein